MDFKTYAKQNQGKSARTLMKEFKEKYPGVKVGANPYKQVREAHGKEVNVKKNTKSKVHTVKPPKKSGGKKSGHVPRGTSKGKLKTITPPQAAAKEKPADLAKRLFELNPNLSQREVQKKVKELTGKTPSFSTIGKAQREAQNRERNFAKKRKKGEKNKLTHRFREVPEHRRIDLLARDKYQYIVQYKYLDENKKLRTGMITVGSREELNRTQILEKANNVLERESNKGKDRYKNETYVHGSVELAKDENGRDIAYYNPESVV